MPRPARSRLRGGLLLVAVLVVLASSGASEIAAFVTDLWWFRELGQEGVFWTSLSARWATGGAFGLAFFVLLYANVLVARRLAPRAQGTRSTDFRVQMEEALLVLRERLDPYITVLLLAGTLALAAIFGAAAASRWEVFQLALHQVPFGTPDPQFGRDVGFFVFALPALRLLTGWFLGALGITLAVTALVHVFDGAIRPWTRLGGFDPHVKAHLSVIAALLAAVKVLDYYVRIFELNFSARGQVLGASYTDVYAQLPALKLLMGIAALAAVVLLLNIRFRGWRLPAAALGLWAAAALLAGQVYPALVQQFRVTPNEVAAESPFIQRNILATRRAFDLEGLEVRPFAADDGLTAQDLQADSATIGNARLWDPRVVIQSYKQLQEIRYYYDFNDVDIDRYPVQGAERQLLVAARELNASQLQEQANTWLNRHLVYTHGYGAVVSPVNQASPNGLPDFLVKDIPPVGLADLKIARPELYFGEETSDYVITNTSLPEFDYPVGDKNAVTTYRGKAGVPLGSPLARLLFAVRFGSAKILLSNYLRPESRVLFARAIRERAGRLVPWLALDRDPYLVIADGRLVWILDGYTSSRHYPYSQPVAGGVNYLRNSVKITIDAYDGTTRLYAIDARDPVLAAWRGIFPGLFTDAGAMPASIRAHLRYPEDLFAVQAEVYKTYHMEDPQVFYNKEDQWALPGEGSDRGPMKPFYVLMRLPEHQTSDFLLMQPFTPRNRDNMIGWMAAQCDPQSYGKRLVYTFPKQRLVIGPEQVSARINQDPTISQQLSLWNQRGSSVLFGNLLVLPVKQSILYIQPLYMQAERTAMPALTRVIVVYGERVAMEATLPAALSRIFGNEAPPATTTPRPEPAAAGPAPAPWARAQELYDKALAAQRAGDWAGYGRYIEELGRLIGGQR